jgi:chromate transporter
MTSESIEPPPHPTLRAATKVWARIGLLSFGGPAGQIALMHRELVEDRRWISESRFLHALNFCMLLPGPEAQQLATYVGWLLHGWRGGLVAGTLFVIPGLVVITALSTAYAVLTDLAWLTALFFGLKAAVLAIVVEATIRVGRRAIRNAGHLTIAIVAFVTLFAFAVPFPIIVLAAGVVGFVGSAIAPGVFSTAVRRSQNADAPALIDEHCANPHRSWRRTLATAGLWVSLWAAPLLPIAIGGGNNVLYALWLFFSQMAIVTFGGAYAVLAYVAQEAVAGFGWLQPGEMIDGLALAETTPGPLVLVLSFVGFLAAFRGSMGIDPILAGVVGALLTAWVTFVPCFLWIFLGAPYVERLRTNRGLSGALTAITAAVVGVIFNLAVWFAMHVLFREVGVWNWGPLHVPAPSLISLDWIAVALSVVAALALLALRWSILPTLALTGALSLGWHLLT